MRSLYERAHYHSEQGISSKSHSPPASSRYERDTKTLHGSYPSPGRREAHVAVAGQTADESMGGLGWPWVGPAWAVWGAIEQWQAAMGTETTGNLNSTLCEMGRDGCAISRGANEHLNRPGGSPTFKISGIYLQCTSRSRSLEERTGTGARGPCKV